jgi:hypothetical protein
MKDSRLVPLYREMAASDQNFHGLTILQHAEQIGKLIKTHKVKTLLDYGCGRADAYRSPFKVWDAWGLKWSNVALYDPAFERYERLPDRRFDMVLCSDVLEHVPEEDVERFIVDLFDHAKVLVWASVCCRPAKKTFPQTGENLHVTVKSFEWWREKLAAAATLIEVGFVLVETP